MRFKEPFRLETSGGYPVELAVRTTASAPRALVLTQSTTRGGEGTVFWLESIIDPSDSGQVISGTGVNIYANRGATTVRAVIDDWVTCGNVRAVVFSPDYRSSTNPNATVIGAPPGEPIVDQIALTTAPDLIDEPSVIAVLAGELDCCAYAFPSTPPTTFHVRPLSKSYTPACSDIGGTCDTAIDCCNANQVCGGDGRCMINNVADGEPCDDDLRVCRNGLECGDNNVCYSPIAALPKKGRFTTAEVVIFLVAVIFAILGVAVFLWFIG